LPDAWVFAHMRRLLPRRLYHAILYRALPGVRRWGPHQGAYQLNRRAPVTNPGSEEP
jgi:hypothetical protein